MRSELILAVAVGVAGLMLMATNTPICSNNCFIDDFFELFLPRNWEKKAGGPPLILMAIGLALHSAWNRR